MNDNIIPLHSAADEPQPFDFNGQAVRVIDIDGEPWFVAADVAVILGYREAYDLTRGLDEDEKGPQIVRTPGGDQSMTCISESGLYSAILRSRVEGAKAFKKWVTGTVLPAIRKTGSYGAPKELTFEEMVERTLLESRARIRKTGSYGAPKELTFEEMVERTLLESRARIQALESSVQELEPKANAWDRLCGAGGDKSASEAAKMLARGGVPVGGLHKLYALCDKKRSEGGLGWFFTNGHGQREPYQRVVDQGLIRVKTGSYENSRTGELVMTITPRFTAKALDAIARHLGAAA